MWEVSSHVFGRIGIRSVTNDKMRRDVTKRIAARVYGAATRYYLNERFVQEKWCFRTYCELLAASWN